jgi:CHAP domain-containing protein
MKTIIKNLLFICLFLFFSTPQNTFSVENTSTFETILLPHTDGQGLETKLPPLEEGLRNKLYEQSKRSCLSDCVTPFGQLLGQADGAKAYSNCRSVCVKPEFSFLNLNTNQIVYGNSNPDKNQFHYIGVIHQCVEYARKWWMLNQRITFGSIDSAFEIIYLAEAKNIDSSRVFELARSINGSAKRAPKRGDLLVYAADRKRKEWRHGHVAVIVAVNLVNGTVNVAEENYNNQPWENPLKYSRQLELVKTNAGYQINDSDKTQQTGQQLGTISGWIYPLVTSN